MEDQPSVLGDGRRYPTRRMTQNPYAPTVADCSNGKLPAFQAVAQCCPICHSRQFRISSRRNGKPCWCCGTPLDATDPRWIRVLLNVVLVTYLPFCIAFAFGQIPKDIPAVSILSLGWLLAPILRLIVCPFYVQFVPSAELFPNSSVATQQLREEYEQRSRC